MADKYPVAARTAQNDRPLAAPDPGAEEADAQRRGRIAAVVRRHGPPAALTGLLLSLMIHIIGGILAALISFGIAQSGGAGSGHGAEIELAVMTEGELAVMQDASLEAAGIEAPDLASAELVADIPLEMAGGDALAGLGTDLGAVSTAAGGGDIGGDSLGLEGGGGGGAASFFGVEARGTRFAYIVDVSGSMEKLPGEERGRIQVLQLELAKSLGALSENASYVVILYNDQTYPLGGEVKWTDASDAAKRRSREQIEQLQAAGGTEPVPAFQAIFRMRPRPDAIYFMTDGEFSEVYREQIRMLNGGFRIPIHCISFVSRAGELTMQGIAKDSGGTYTYVPGRGG